MSGSYTLEDLAKRLGAQLKGDGTTPINGLATLQTAEPGQISFLANPAYQRYLASTRASAVLLDPRFAAGDEGQAYQGNVLILNNPYLGYAQLSALFDNSPRPQAGIHPSATVAASSHIQPNVAIGPNAVIGEEVIIGAGSVIGAGALIGDHSVLGEGCKVSANVTVYHGVSIGNHVVIHSGAVIGADGFGFAPDSGTWLKIHQLGGVVIGDDVEIGACTTIDRGALGNTEIAEGVKIDNHVMIAHNVKIGAHSAMAAFVGISGSTTVGSHCTFAGMVGVVGHITICDNVHITGQTVVSKPITEPGSYSSGTHMSTTREWRRNAARFNQLNEMNKRLRRLEKGIEE